ncbi:hypothetical protein SeMB42_g06140, partial [Synchytrium endobioticum]
MADGRPSFYIAQSLSPSPSPSPSPLPAARPRPRPSSADARLPPKATKKQKSVAPGRPLDLDLDLDLRQQWLPVQPLPNLLKLLAKSPDPSTTLAAAAAAQLHSNLTMPFGLYSNRLIPYHSKDLRHVLELPEKKRGPHPTIATLDAKGLCLWDNTMSRLLNRAPFARRSSNRNSSKHNQLSPFSKCLHSRAGECLIVGGDSPDIRILDLDFVQQCCLVTPRNVISMHFIDSRRELLTGEIGGIHVYKLIRRKKKSTTTYELLPRLDIRDWRDDEWVFNVQYDLRLDKLFAMSEKGIGIYDIETGSRLHTLTLDTNEVATSMVYYPPLEYTITGSRNGRVRIWSSRLKALRELRGHTHQISSLALMEPFDTSLSSWGTLPICISSSLDATIRLWHLETGECLQRVDIGQPVLEMSLTAPDTLLTVTSDSLQYWNIGRHRLFFAHLGSMPLILRRLHTDNPRILCATADGAIRLLSPVTGQTLSLGYPSVANATTSFSHLEYDPTRRLIYAFSPLSCFVYNTSTNPMTISAEWKTDPDHYVFCGVSNQYSQAYFEVLAGTKDGKIVTLDMQNNLSSKRLCLAHSGPLSILKYDAASNILVSYGNDMTIKAWTPSTFTTQDAVSSITGLSLVRIISLQQPPSSKVAHFNTFACSIICEFQGHLRDISLQNDNHQVLLQDQSPQPSKALDCLTKYCCYASGSGSADDDGAVRVWDSDGSMVRDIQIGCCSKAMCFANERGDLLIGTELGIAIVPCQEYMPSHLLKRVLETNPKDDSIETLCPFDEHMNIWSHAGIANQEEESITNSARPASAATFRLQLPTKEELARRRRRVDKEVEAAAREASFVRHAKHVGALALPFTKANPAHTWEMRLAFDGGPMENFGSIADMDLSPALVHLGESMRSIEEPMPSANPPTSAEVHEALLQAFASTQAQETLTASSAFTSASPAGQVIRQEVTERQKKRSGTQRGLDRRGLKIPNSVAATATVT